MSSSSFEKKTSSIVSRTNTECSPSQDKIPTTHRKKKKQRMTIKSKGKTPEIHRIAKTDIDSEYQMQHCKTEECQDVLKATWNKDSNNATATNWTATVSKRDNNNTINTSESAQQPRMITKEQYEKHNKQSSLMQWDVNQDEEAELVQSFEGIIGYQKSQQSQLFPSLRRSQLESAAMRSQNGSAGYAEINNIPSRKQQSSHAESEFSRSAQMNTLKKLGILFDAIEQNHLNKQQPQQQQMKESIYSSKQMNPWLGSTQQNYNSMNIESQNAHNHVNSSNNNSAISSPVFNPKMVLPIGPVVNQFNQVQSAKSKKVPMIRVENTSNQSDINNNLKTAPIRALQSSVSASALSFSTLLVKSPTLASSSVLEGVRIENPFGNQLSDKHRLYQKNQSCQSLVALLSEKYKFAIASIQQQYEVMDKNPQEPGQNTQMLSQSTRSKTNSPLNIDTYRKKGFFYLQKLQAMREESLKKSAVPLGKQETINRRLLFPSQPNNNNNGANHQPNKLQETVALTSQSQPRQQLLSTNQQTKQQEYHSQSENKQTKAITVLMNDTNSDCILDNKGSEQEKQNLSKNKVVVSGVVQKVKGIEKQISTKNNLTIRIQTEPNMYENNNNNHTGNANSAQQPTRKQQQQSSQKEKTVKINIDFSSGTTDKDFQFNSPVPQNSSKFKQTTNAISNNYSNTSRSPSRRQSKSIYETNIALRDYSQEKTNSPGQQHLFKQCESNKDNANTKSSNNPLLHVLLTSKSLTSSSNEPATISNAGNNCRNIPVETSQQKYNKRLLLLKPLQLDGIAVNTIESCVQSDRYQHKAPNLLNSDRDLTVKRTYSTHISSATSKISKMPQEFVNSFLARYTQSHSSPQPANAVTKMSGQICKTIQRQLNWYGS